MLQPNTIPVAYRAPFAIGTTPYRDARPHGETVWQIVKSVPCLPREFNERGIVCINGEVVPRVMWPYVRPKPPTDNLPVAVTLHYPLGTGGGGGNSSKSIIGLVAAIALIAVAAAISGGALGVAGGIFGGSFLFGAGSTSALLLSGAVTVAGALAISALTAPPTTQEAQQQIDTNTDNKEPAGAQGNMLSPGGAIPRVLGSRKVFPPFVTEPLVELIDGNEYVEALMALNGPHLLEDIRLDGVSIESAEDVELETFEGWSTDTAPTLVTRQGRTTTPQVTLSQHIVGDNDQTLKHTSSPTDDLPIWHQFVTRDSTDEVWLHLLWPGGLVVGGSSRTAVPFRIRMRQQGDTAWINFPEVHFANDSIKQLRTAILLKWQLAADDLATAPTPNGFYYANFTPPPQTATAPTSVDTWVADGYFDKGGNDSFYNGVEAASRIANMNLYSDRVEFYLTDLAFPRGIWEIEVKRGVSYNPTTFNKISYAYPSFALDFFWYQGTVTPQVLQSQANVSDHCTLTRVVSVWNAPPYTPSDKYFALIALRARNRSIQRISVQASGYVRDYLLPTILLHCDGTDGSTTFTDSSDNAYTVTASGSAAIDTVTSVFGGASAEFDGSNDYLRVSTGIISIPGDFTLDFRVLVSTIKKSELFNSQGAGAGFFAVYMFSAGGVVSFYSGEDHFFTPALSADTWYHIAITRSAGTVYMFLDGVLQSTSAIATTLEMNAPLIGANLSNEDLDGWIDEFRFINGTAVWTADFSPPTSAYTGRDGWTTTNNPGLHYIDVLSGEQNLDPLPDDLRDDDGIIEWIRLCDDNNWTADAIIDDMRTQDVLALLASCAYARPYQSDQYGVTIDNDKSDESPVQVFSRINASNVKFERAFLRAPEAFIVNYRNEASDDDRAQTIVYQSDPSIATTGVFETISYDGLIEQDKVEARALFDLDQANQRATFYSLDADIESIVCRRGSLVALQHDVLTSRAGDGHVYSKTTTVVSAVLMITEIVLDTEINVVQGSTGVAIRHTDGSITTHALSNATESTDTLTFTTSIVDDGTILGYNQTSREYGSLVVAGELGTEYKRMLVQQISATKDLKASLVLVDEAPNLVRF